MSKVGHYVIYLLLEAKLWEKHLWKAWVRIANNNIVHNSVVVLLTQPLKWALLTHWVNTYLPCRPMGGLQFTNWRMLRYKCTSWQLSKTLDISVALSWIFPLEQMVFRTGKFLNSHWCMGDLTLFETLTVGASACVTDITKVPPWNNTEILVQGPQLSSRIWVSAMIGLLKKPLPISQWR